MIEALIGFAVMMVLSLARLPIALAMGAVGFGGLWVMRGLPAAAASVTTVVYESGFQYALSVVPLFILMGNLITRAGMSEELFAAAYAWVGHWRGGLAMATVVASAGFGSVCGSSVATAATMAKVCYPPMKRLGYSPALATGAIAAGGTLGILIPPSTVMVIYGIMTETNIGALFAAGMIPGVLATALLMLAVRYVTWRDPAAGPPGPRSDWPTRLRALKGVWGVTVLFVLSVGGIYFGVFTATEGAGVGAFGALIFALWRKSLTWASLHAILAESVRTTAMLFSILIGAMVFANFINYTSMPTDLKNFVAQFSLHPMWVMVGICAIYLILGTAMEELSMILLTVPVFFPLVTGLGFDPVWFGIIIVVVVEIGLISPPVGMNMFVLRTLIPEVPIDTIFRGVTPFVLADTVRLAILVALPVLSTWLPRVLGL
jgi:C4-dicarboxylate transporter, DctM subunit